MAANVTTVQSDLAVVKADCSNYNGRFDTIDQHFLDLKTMSLSCCQRPHTEAPSNLIVSVPTHQSARLHQLFPPSVGVPLSSLKDSSLINSQCGATGSQYEMEQNVDDEY